MSLKSAGTVPSADLDSWGVVALVAATVLGVDVDVDVAAEAAADDGVGAVALGVGAGGREISWSTMEPGRPSLLSSCLTDHETIGHDARPVYLIDSYLSLSDLPLERLGRVRERGMVNASELPLGNRSGSAPVPKAGAGVREDECAKRSVVHLR